MVAIDGIEERPGTRVIMKIENTRLPGQQLAACVCHTRDSGTTRLRKHSEVCGRHQPSAVL